MDKPNQELKDRLVFALSKRNMKPIELSEKTKISKSAISQYCSGYAKPKTDRIYTIAKALDVSEAWLLGFDVPMESNSALDKNFNDGVAEGKLLKKYSQLTEENKSTVRQMIDFLLANQNKEP